MTLAHVGRKLGQSKQVELQESFRSLRNALVFTSESTQRAPFPAAVIEPEEWRRFPETRFDILVGFAFGLFGWGAIGFGLFVEGGLLEVFNKRVEREGLKVEIREKLIDC